MDTLPKGVVQITPLEGPLDRLYTQRDHPMSPHPYT